jgi:hypothetical protein
MERYVDPVPFIEDPAKGVNSKWLDSNLLVNTNNPVDILS